MSCSSRFARPVLTALALTALAGCGGSGGEQASGSAPSSPGAATPGAASSAAEPAPPPVPDYVVARVNSAEIRNRQLVGAVETNRMRQQAEGIALDANGERTLREGVLDAAIAEELLFQDAKVRGVLASPEEVERDLTQVRSRFESKEVFDKYLADAGLTDAEVRAFAERRVIVEKHLKALAGDTKVTDAEAKAFYDSNKELFREPEQARVQIVVVRTAPTDPEPKRQDARKRVEEARAKAAAGGDMAEIAKQYSQVPSAENGGDLGWFRKGEMYPGIEKAAFSLPAGSVSEVFETPTGLNFLRVTERKESRTLPFDEVKARLIVDLGRIKEAQAMERRVHDLRKTATVEIVDRSFLEPRGASAENAPGGNAARPPEPTPAAGN